MNKTKNKRPFARRSKGKEICDKLKISIKMYKRNIQFIKQNFSICIIGYIVPAIKGVFLSFIIL